MKELTKKQFHKQLTDQFISEQFSSYLAKHPGKRSDAALYAAGRLQTLLLEAIDELPYHPYQFVLRQLKG
jgi:hypothetical protein